MTIHENPKHDVTPQDAEVLRKLYLDQLRDYEHELEAAQTKLVETEAAMRQHVAAIERKARVEGRIDALRMLAARDGITL